MNTDIRVSTNFFENRKTRRLMRRKGSYGVLCVLRLWIWAAKFQPDGDLSFIDYEDLMDAMESTDESLVDLLIEIGFLDDSDGLRIHQWSEHNPWAVDAEKRSEKARKAAKARWENSKK